MMTLAVLKSSNLKIYKFLFLLYFQGIGNGLSLGALMTTLEIASVLAQKIMLMHKTGGVSEQRKFDRESIQFNTFGGNPVCSAGGLAVLRVIDKEKRQVHCADVGSHLLGRIRDLQERYESEASWCFNRLLVFWSTTMLLPIHCDSSVSFWSAFSDACGLVIGDVGGRGLMVGRELVYDRNEKIPAKAETASLFEKLRGIKILSQLILLIL
ncbi:hypothetical protein DVH24_033995 [Malus domestica]|uniref:Uncharacterized protein n=1 Tax=Malus domestica TaxID=3750 RepID=A0A498KNM4_MALDO|nr:hypothetical protein DVH24_033995 [Malus domestica]